VCGRRQRERECGRREREREPRRGGQTYTEKVGDDTVAGGALDVVVHHRGLDAIRPRPIRVMVPEEGLDVARMISEHAAERVALDALYHSCRRRRGYDAVRRQLQIQPLVQRSSSAVSVCTFVPVKEVKMGLYRHLELAVHDAEHLEDELILT
jgi:hypothetical protein